MISPNVHPEPEDLHPSLWWASRCATRCIDTGHAALSKQLPDGGWPTGTLVKLLIQQPGIDEMHVLAPALLKVTHKSVVFLPPSHAPQSIALLACPAADRTRQTCLRSPCRQASASCGASALGLTSRRAQRVG